jgi:HNH endonuclease
MRSSRPAPTASAVSSPKRTDVASRPALGKHAWQKLRARALQRDGNRCRRCPNSSKLQVHHVVRPEDRGTDDLGNLITLCDRCHRLTHKAMGKGRRQRLVGGLGGSTSFPPDPLGLEYPSPIEGKNGSRPEESYEDDPENGIFWGPKQPNGMMTRWSRPWFDWRNEQSLAPDSPGRGLLWDSFGLRNEN